MLASLNTPLKEFAQDPKLCQTDPMPGNISVNAKVLGNNPNGAIIRELSSGQILFIQEVINDRSDLIRCIAGPVAENMSLPASPSNNKISEDLRKQVMLNMSVHAPVGTNFVPMSSTFNLKQQWQYNIGMYLSFQLL